ncbi:hypothetical protein AEA01_11640 [Xanthomonas campestris pv. campestris]|nr:hypothetical protein [Xanthomonas campestris]AKS20510.1 hypothetical protein AEA01_11640 [Xanthomonas campestris pv. campestris]
MHYELGGPLRCALSCNSATTFRCSSTESLDVRSWEKHWHNYNREGTLTLNVRDIDHPVWTIKFGNETEMNKWYELVSQAVNEKLKL